MQRLGFSPRRVGFLALNTLHEALRQKVVAGLVILAGLVVLGAQGFRDFHFGTPELKFIADLGVGAMGAFGAVLTVCATAQLFFSELERRTVLTLLAKPVGRGEFVMGKYLGVVVLTAGFCLLLTGLVGAALWHRESALVRQCPDVLAGGRLVNFGHLAVTGLFQWLKLLVLAALTLLVATYARTQLFTTGCGLVLYVICHLQPLALAVSVRPGASAATEATGLLLRAVPNFQLFTLPDTLGPNGRLEWNLFARVVLYASGYVAAACGLAVYCFRRREI